MKPELTSAIRVRFAPSPTGHLHIGGLRTALFNELFARHTGGTFLLRIEDTDRERSLPEYTQSILNSLQWAGIHWDEPLVIQSERLAVHQQVIAQLLAQEKAYRCYCTAEEAAARGKAAVGHADEVSFSRYDGRCWTNRETLRGINKPFAVRFKIPEGRQSVIFDDLIRGRVEFQREQLDDFVIARSDGWPMYNFVVVVDDAFMNITHVIRGEDHISNTPKQILLYEACNYGVPQFAHLPLILGADGNRLSKRDAATAVTDYRRTGYVPEALINYLVRLGWAHGDQEVFSKQELVDFFSIEAVGKKGAIFNQAKLDWLNGIYLKEISAARILDIIVQDVEPRFYELTPEWIADQRIQLIDLYKTREKTIADIAQKIVSLYSMPLTYEQAAVEQWITKETSMQLDAVIVLLSSSTWTVTDLSAVTKKWCQEQNIKLVSVAQAMRIAMTGSSAAPGIFELLAIVGKEESIARLLKFREFLA